MLRTAAAVMALACPAALAQTFETPPIPGPEVPFVATPEEVVDAMLRLAAVGPADVVYDLGCGDGRIPIRAAKAFGARGVGVELDSRLVAEAREAAARAGVAERVEFREQDLFGADVGEATVVALYLFRRVNLELRPKLLAELRPGARIVSHQFDMGDDWRPDRTVVVAGRPIHLWTIPTDPERRKALAARRR
jgi:SAM-dependent methyltransferase